MLKKNCLFASSILGAVLSFCCAASGMAADSLTYQVTANHTDGKGLTTPFLDKEISFQVTFRRGSDFTVSQKVAANTDSNGQATLTVDPGARPGFDYAGIELFCAKLDGPHYCNGSFPTTDNSLNPTDDAADIKYNCSYSLVAPQARLQAISASLARTNNQRPLNGSLSRVIFWRN